MPWKKPAWVGKLFSRKKPEAKAPAAKQSWKTLIDVKRLSFSRGKDKHLVRIGHPETQYGDVYAGRMRFKNGKSYAVAIKVFKKPMDDETAIKTQQVIAELRKAGVRVPKSSMFQVAKGPFAGKWVKVSQLFGSVSKGSKLSSKSHFRITDPGARRQAIFELTKTANAGYYPAPDLIEPFTDAKKGVIPLDFDLLVKFGKLPANECALELIDRINSITFNRPEQKSLFLIALESASLELKAELQRQALALGSSPRLSKSFRERSN
ncbi:MAG: hypothetical protein Q7R70_05235 [Candidatus Diapherotrites archaeon]|nr:hypothetical protein [Candidatus Diapherotrites archaeon]